MHARTLENSPRLQQTLGVLSDGKRHTSAEIRNITKSVCVGTDISELRHNGKTIECQLVGKTDEGNKVYEYWQIDNVKRDIRQSPRCPKCGHFYRDHDTGRCKDCGESIAVPVNFYGDQDEVVTRTGGNT